MNQIEKLEHLLNKDMILLYCSNTKTAFTFEEHQSTKAGLEHLTIKNIPANALIFSCDVKDKGITNQFINNSCQIKGVNKGCDLVIIFEKESALYAVFGEMKSFEDNKVVYQPQLQNSYLLVDYLRRMINLFDNESIEFKPFFYLFYLYKNRKYKDNKQGRVTKKRTHTNPEKEINIEYESFDKPMENSENCYKWGFYAPKTNRLYSREVDFNDLIADKISTKK
jgi:hypothetical protein